MKEIITIEIGEKSKDQNQESKALVIVPNTEKTGFKQFVSKILAYFIGKESKDSSALLKLGVAVKKYRFSLAIVGLVFMLIFRNDNTKAIGLNIDENKPTSLKEQAQKIKTDEDKSGQRKKSPIKSQKIKTEKAAKSEAAEEVKTYHIPNIPELSNRKKINGDLAKNSAKAMDLYISKYIKLAKAEALRTKIPASVILGLALVNSTYGLSKTATEANNHFDIKCGENSIAMGKGMKGQYVNSDFCFTEYSTVSASYKAQGNIILKSLKKYNNSKQITVSSVIRSLEESGYFTTRGFGADDLKTFIKENNLNSYNQ